MELPKEAVVKKLILLFVSVLLAGCATVPRPVSTAAVESAGPPPYDAWARVLTKYVDARGRVDFAAMAKDRSDLDRFVAYVYDIGPATHPQQFPTADHVMAFHINAYNALAMHNVLEAGIPATLEGLAKVNFFYLRKVQVGGVPISLYDYENKVIRALGEPRIHVALNCMVVGCPRLPRERFVAEQLNAQLEREAATFFNEERNVQIDAARQKLRFSAILQFYTADFLASAPSLTAYVNRYRTVKLPETYAVDFIDYDWTINAQQRP